jgi:hypothetical protein
MLVYGAQMLIGGGLSVLPLPILPFSPEQSYAHHLSHAAYAAAQLPLVVACLQRIEGTGQEVSFDGVDIVLQIGLIIGTLA